jgi:WD40 repeat protein
MTRRKKYSLLAIGSLALVGLAVLFGCPLGLRLRIGEDRPTILEGHRSPVQALAFGPDGTILTTAAGFLTNPREEAELIVWDVQTRRPRVCHTGFQGDLCALALSPDGAVLATAAGDGTVRLWDTATTRERVRLGEHRSPLGALAFSADGSRLASADRGNALMLWDLAGQRQWTSHGGHDRFVHALAFAPDGRTLASVGTDTTVRLWDVATGKGRTALTGHATAITAVAFAPDGRTLASGDRGGVVKLWDLTTGEERATLAAAAPLSQGLQTMQQQGMMFIQEVAALAFTPDGHALAVAVDQTVRLWDVGTGSSVASLAGHGGKVQCLAYSPDGTLLASGGHDRTVRLWDVARYRAREP